VSVVGFGWAHCWVLRKRAVFGVIAFGWWPCFRLRRWGFCGSSAAVDVSRRYEGAWAAGLLVVVWFSCGLVFRHTGLVLLGGAARLGGGAWWGWVFGGGWAGFCLLFVNCIVDASIFVAKFFRAHGGCLGIRSR
jgi:hypothetical protein